MLWDSHTWRQLRYQKAWDTDNHLNGYRGFFQEKGGPLPMVACARGGFSTLKLIKTFLRPPKSEYRLDTLAAVIPKDDTMNAVTCSTEFATLEACTVPFWDASLYFFALLNVVDSHRLRSSFRQMKATKSRCRSRESHVLSSSRSHYCI